MNKRLLGLDIVRIILALVICAYHTSIHLGCDYGIAQGFIRNGAVVMTSFFILSGFSLVISNYVVEDGCIKRFYLKRAISIIPMYYICAIASDAMYVAYSFIEGGGLQRVKEVLLLAPIEILGLQSFFTTLFPYNHNGGTWFISCLVFCYFLYPFIVRMVKKTNDRNRIIICVLLSCILVYSAFIVKWFDLSGIYTNPFMRMLEFTIGVITGCLYKNRKDINTKSMTGITSFVISIIALFIGITVAYNVFRYENYMLYSWLVVPISVFMIYSSTCIKIEGTRIGSIITWLSNITYCLFLAQLFSNNICKLILSKTMVDSNLCKIGLGWMICIIIAFVLHYIFEIQIKRVLSSKLTKKGLL